jgi:pimeloyl-ACP methyl ester carboxylesterase
MSELVAIRGTSNPNRRGDVVFVHGLNGDARATWQPEGKPELFWPEWLHEDIPNIGVWSLGYEASSFGWNGSTMPLVDRAINALVLLETDDIGKEKPVVFITHSLGGLLVKEMLRKATDNSVQEGKQLANHIRGVVFLSTPHSGSDLANFVDFLKVLLPSDSVRELRPNEPRLRELNTWYRNNIDNLDIKTQIYCERRKTPAGKKWFGRFFGIMVVDAISSDLGIAGVTAVPMDDDHITICRPKSKENLMYRRILNFIPEQFDKSRIVDSKLENESLESGVPRKFEAAMPKKTSVGLQTEVRVMISLQDSQGLRLNLPDWTEGGDLIAKTDVIQSVIPLVFPLLPMTNKLLPAKVFIAPKAMDFCVDSSRVACLYVSPYLDSGIVTFLLTPLHVQSRSYVVVEVFNDQECTTLLGSLTLMTEINAESRRVTSEVWQIRSMSCLTEIENSDMLQAPNILYRKLLPPLYAPNTVSMAEPPPLHEFSPSEKAAPKSYFLRLSLAVSTVIIAGVGVSLLYELPLIHTLLARIVWLLKQFGHSP